MTNIEERFREYRRIVEPLRIEGAAHIGYGRKKPLVADDIDNSMPMTYTMTFDGALKRFYLDEITANYYAKYLKESPDTFVEFWRADLVHNARKAFDGACVSRTRQGVHSKLLVSTSVLNRAESFKDTLFVCSTINLNHTAKIIFSSCTSWDSSEPVWTQAEEKESVVV